jgi:hypothetical protein
MKYPLSSLLLGSALIAFGAASALAQAQQTTPAPNPFGGAAPQTTPEPAPKKPRAAPSLKSGQYATESEAKSNCSGDSVVWANIGTRVYHRAGTPRYGTTKRGAYMCEKDTAAAGFRAAKNESR